MAKKTKCVVIITAIVFVIVTFMLVRLSIMSLFSDQTNIKEYVIKDRENLTQFAQFIYYDCQESFGLYENVDDISEESGIKNIRSDLKIKLIVVWKNEYGDYVQIILKDKPKDKNYDECGIYYSVSGVILDDEGHAQSGDVYTYSGNRMRYKTEKIIDNWYYYEEAHR